MVMKFISDPIDLVETNKRAQLMFKPDQEPSYREYRPKTLIFYREIGWPIVAMAASVTRRGFDLKAYKGVKMCLQYQISKLKIREYLLGIIPIPSPPFPFGSPYLGVEQSSLLADSLILTSLTYQLGAPVFPEELEYARRTYRNAVEGFQWACHWAINRKSLKQTENDLIEVFEKGQLKFLLEDICEPEWNLNR